MKLTTLLAFSSLTLITQNSLAVMTLQNYSAPKHHRFANDPSFIGSGYDWSGVARASNGRWVTMISSTCFISAAHAAPGVGNSVTFHANNDPLGATISRTINSVTTIGGTDLVIGELNSSPGPTIAFYSVASNTTNEANFLSSVYSDRIAFAVGLNNAGAGTQQFRVGRNELDGFTDDATDGPSTGDAITFDYDAGFPESLGDDEAFLQNGDSGAPLFVTHGGELILTGINWYISTPPDVPRSLSGTTFVPNYINDINTELATKGDSLTLVSVPEPSSLLLLGMTGLGLMVRRRKF